MTTQLKYVAAFTALTTALYATNGDHLIGLGAKARGMGGVGIAAAHGAESALANPAMITSVNKTEISFGGTLFMPKVETDTGSGYVKSDADTNVIPEIAIAVNMGNGFYSGVGMWGTAGMGVDYRSQAAGVNDNMVTNLQLMQFGVPLAYKTDALSIGMTPILQYGALDISYGGSTTKGSAQDLTFGYNIGAAYAVSDVTFGAVYKSPIKMHYSGQIAAFTADYGLSGFGDDLEQPAELGAGVAYTMGAHTFAADCKRINWSKAQGYKSFGWKDQDVYALGYQFAENKWAFRAGYNYAKSPIAENTNTTINRLNLLGFPAIIESHYTVGGSYVISKAISLDGAYVYAPETTKTIGATSTKHTQSSITAQLTFNF